MDNRTLLVTGSRAIESRAYVFACLDSVIAQSGGALPSQLVHTGGIGVDEHAVAWARERGVPLRVHRPPHAQGHIVDAVDVVVLIRNGKSGGGGGETDAICKYAAARGKLYQLFISQ